MMESGAAVQEGVGVTRAQVPKSGGCCCKEGSC